MHQLCLEPNAGTAQGSARHDQGPKALCHNQLVSRVSCGRVATPAIALQAPGDRIPRTSYVTHRGAIHIPVHVTIHLIALGSRHNWMHGQLAHSRTHAGTRPRERSARTQAQHARRCVADHIRFLYGALPRDFRSESRELFAGESSLCLFLPSRGRLRLCVGSTSTFSAN
jgi:hypothetical protein